MIELSLRLINIIYLSGEISLVYKEENCFIQLKKKKHVKMIFVLILFLFVSISDQWICHFDSGQICLRGLQSISFILLNQTIEQLRQPASDVTAIRKLFIYLFN
jgi:hypothetical protein